MEILFIKLGELPQNLPKIHPLITFQQKLRCVCVPFTEAALQKQFMVQKSWHISLNNGMNNGVEGLVLGSTLEENRYFFRHHAMGKDIFICQSS